MSYECIYEIRGTVQGVGFRPTLYRLAREAKLGGWVQNRSGSVRLCLQGPVEQVDDFVQALPVRIPAAASIEAIEQIACSQDEAERAALPFSISESEADANRRVAIPADMAMCGDCRREVFATGDRRFRYAFTTCTNCGPRLTVVNSVPYDRVRTTLREFPLCPACEAEYRDPMNRRFHAESTACPDCGPRLHVEWPMRESSGGTTSTSSALEHADPITTTRRALADGKIVALRGLGGYLLACDAMNPEAIRELRKRKARPSKPFAVMARNLEVARRYVEIDGTAGRILTGPEGPVVLLPILAGAVTSTSPSECQSTTGTSRLQRDNQDPRAALPVELISPDTDRLGVMLPITPLHALLFESTTPGDDAPAIDVLIMTSGNHRGEPIAISNEDARRELSDICDLFLMHNREIQIRNDDSVVAMQGDRAQVWRRSRGYSPLPLQVNDVIDRPVLAVGTDMKNTIALGYQHDVVLSPHLGDLQEPLAIRSFEHTLAYLPTYLDVAPQVVAVDLHPDMQSTRIGRAYAAKNSLPVQAVQHHEAHAMACLSEHGVHEGLVLVFDGTGLGHDGTLWGAELLLCEGAKVRRLATFAPVSLPGGEVAILNPVRQLVARWYDAGVLPKPEWLAALNLKDEQIHAWFSQCESGLYSVKSHAAGRLFDSVSVLLGSAPSTASYEGQPAIRLETLALGGQSGWSARFPFASYTHNDMRFIDWSPTFAGLQVPISDRRIAANLARGFHDAVVDAAIHMVEFGLGETDLRRVGLSGGVFMNRLLSADLSHRLETLGLDVLQHRRVPPNDGGIALGQAVLAGLRQHEK